MSIETGIAIALIGSSAVFGYISVNLDKRHSILGWLFLPMSVLQMIVAMITLTEYATNQGVSNILSWNAFVFIIIIMVLIGYLFLFIITRGFEMIMKKKPYDDRLER